MHRVISFAWSLIIKYPFPPLLKYFHRKKFGRNRFVLEGFQIPYEPPKGVERTFQNRAGSLSSACSKSVSMSLSPKTSMPFFLKSAAVTPSPGVSLPEKVPS